MSMRGKKWPRYFAIVVAMVMIVETLAFTMTSYAKNDTNTVYELSNEDKATVLEISNMTGVEADEIVRLRKEGKSWNEILELIKTNADYKFKGDEVKRNIILARTGMGEDTHKMLKEEGFTEVGIMEAKSLVERVVFQLDEISNMQVVPTFPVTGLNDGDPRQDNIASYRALAEKINLDDAVYLILKLHDEFDSSQAIMDEYLYSLQLEIDFKEYITDKDGYIEEKQRKAVELESKDIITISQIEEKMMDMLQSMNNKEEALPEVESGTHVLPDTEKESPVPDVPVPNAENVRPQNPAEAIRQEISNLQDNGSEQSGR